MKGKITHVYIGSEIRHPSIAISEGETQKASFHLQQASISNFEFLTFSDWQ